MLYELISQHIFFSDYHQYGDPGGHFIK